MSMVPARDPRTCPVCEQPLTAGCHACPGPAYRVLRAARRQGDVLEELAAGEPYDVQAGLERLKDRMAREGLIAGTPEDP